MLVGATGSGKTRVYEILEDTMNYMRDNDSKDQVYQNVKKMTPEPPGVIS